MFKHRYKACRYADKPDAEAVSQRKRTKLELWGHTDLFILVAAHASAVRREQIRVFENEKVRFCNLFSFEKVVEIKTFLDE